MDDNHESLPAPEKAPTNTGREIPSVPQGQHSAESEHTAAHAMENPAFASPQQQATQGTGAMSDTTSSKQPMAVPQTGHSQASGVTPTSTPQIADDVDLIEKEWVHKTKEIVHDTKDDPYRQNSQIAHLRADYMKKRYNKDIKLLKEQ